MAVRKLLCALLPAASLVVLALAAVAECIDVNAAPPEDLRRIVHIDEERAAAVVDGRPWPAVRDMTRIPGIGPGRLRDIEEQGLACVGRVVPAGEREVIRGRAVIFDGDTLEVAGERVRLIAIDAPERDQFCDLDGLAWPCGQLATAALFEMAGTDELACEVYGRDRFDWVLAVCFAGRRELNREMVRRGWALAWYPARGAMLGPRYDSEQEEARRAGRGLWRGDFLEPWLWRRGE